MRLLRWTGALILIASWSSPVSSEARGPDVSVALSRVVKRLTIGDADAVEYRGARKVAYFDVDGDGKAEAIASYTIEGWAGSNGASFHLTVWKVMPGVTLVEVATTEISAITSGSPYGAPTLGEHGRIVVPVLKSAPEDARCCPSIKGEVLFVLKDGKLAEERPRPSNSPEHSGER